MPASYAGRILYVDLTKKKTVEEPGEGFCHRHPGGWNAQTFELMKASERASTLAQVLNVREEFTPR